MQCPFPELTTRTTTSNMPQGSGAEAISHHLTSKGAIRLPPLPSDDLLLHQAKEYRKAVRQVLADEGLLNVCLGEAPEEAEKLVIVPLEQVPELPEDHRDYERRRTERLRIQLENHKNTELRFRITMKEWTRIYNAIIRSVEASSPVFKQQLARGAMRHDGHSRSRRRLLRRAAGVSPSRQKGQQRGAHSS